MRRPCKNWFFQHSIGHWFTRHLNWGRVHHVSRVHQHSILKLTYVISFNFWKVASIKLPETYIINVRIDWKFLITYPRYDYNHPNASKLQIQYSTPYKILHAQVIFFCKYYSATVNCIQPLTCPRKSNKPFIIRNDKNRENISNSIFIRMSMSCGRKNWKEQKVTNSHNV